MGFIRGSLFVVLSVLFFTSLLVGNAFLMFSLSLDYETVKPEFATAIHNLANGNFNLDSEIEKSFDIMQFYCQTNQEFVFNGGGYTFNIPCEIVFQGPGEVVDYGINSMIEESYYNEYDCSLLNCLEETGSPAFLISQKSKDYFNSKFYWVLGISLILAFLMFILTSERANWFFVVGTLLVISSLPFTKLNWLVSFIPDSTFINFFELFFIKSYSVFLISLISGITLIVIGIIVKFFIIGFQVNNFISWWKKRKEEKESVTNPRRDLQEEKTAIKSKNKNLVLPKVLKKKDKIIK